MVAPPAGMAKLNCDAAFLSETGDAWGGAVARDYRGLVFLSTGRRLEHCASVEEAEASAIQLGLTELSRFYRGPITVEVDCSTVGRELLNDGACRSAWSAVMLNIKKLLPTFPSVEVSVVRRNQNKLAHEIAAEARASGDHMLIANVHVNVRQTMVSELITTNA